MNFKNYNLIMELKQSENSFLYTKEGKFQNNLGFNNKDHSTENQNFFNRTDDGIVNNNYKLSKFKIENSNNVYWVYHSNFIVEEELIKKIFCTWTPFYIDLNLIINECIKQNKEIIILENKYIIDLKHNFFYSMKNPNIRRYISSINLNETLKFSMKRIFRCAQNLRIDRLNLLENLNGMDKELDWYTEKYSKIEDRLLFKQLNEFIYH